MLIAFILVIIFVPILTLLIEHLVLHAAACYRKDDTQKHDHVRRSRDDR